MVQCEGIVSLAILCYLFSISAAEVDAFVVVGIDVGLLQVVVLNNIAFFSRLSKGNPLHSPTVSDTAVLPVV